MATAEQTIKTRIAHTLAACQSGNLADRARDLFASLGYRSDRTLDAPIKQPRDLLSLALEFGYAGPTDPEKFLLDEWQAVHLLFQLTADELRDPEQSRLLFSGDSDIDATRYHAYLVIAIALKSGNYARGHLSQITRQINGLFAMPVLLLFKHGDRLTLAVVDRRLNKRD